MDTESESDSSDVEDEQMAANNRENQENIPPAGAVVAVRQRRLRRSDGSSREFNRAMGILQENRPIDPFMSDSDEEDEEDEEEEQEQENDSEEELDELEDEDEHEEQEQQQDVEMPNVDHNELQIIEILTGSYQEFISEIVTLLPSIIEFEDFSWKLHRTPADMRASFLEDKALVGKTEGEILNAITSINMAFNVFVFRAVSIGFLTEPNQDDIRKLHIKYVDHALNVITIYCMTFLIELWKWSFVNYSRLIDNQKLKKSMELVGGSSSGMEQSIDNDAWEECLYLSLRSIWIIFDVNQELAFRLVTNNIMVLIMSVAFNLPTIVVNKDSSQYLRQSEVDFIRNWNDSGQPLPETRKQIDDFRNMFYRKKETALVHAGFRKHPHIIARTGPWLSKDATLAYQIPASSFCELFISHAMKLFEKNMLLFVNYEGADTFGDTYPENTAVRCGKILHKWTSEYFATDEDFENYFEEVNRDHVVTLVFLITSLQKIEDQIVRDISLQSDETGYSPANVILFSYMAHIFESLRSCEMQKYQLSVIQEFIDKTRQLEIISYYFRLFSSSDSTLALDNNLVDVYVACFSRNRGALAFTMFYGEYDPESIMNKRESIHQETLRHIQQMEQQMTLAHEPAQVWLASRVAAYYLLLLKKRTDVSNMERKDFSNPFSVTPDDKVEKYKLAETSKFINPDLIRSTSSLLKTITMPGYSEDRDIKSITIIMNVCSYIVGLYRIYKPFHPSALPGIGRKIASNSSRKFFARDSYYTDIVQALFGDFEFIKSGVIKSAGQYGTDKEIVFSAHINEDLRDQLDVDDDDEFVVDEKFHEIRSKLMDTAGQLKDGLAYRIVGLLPLVMRPERILRSAEDTDQPSDSHMDDDFFFLLCELHLAAPLRLLYYCYNYACMGMRNHLNPFESPEFLLDKTSMPDNKTTYIRTMERFYKGLDDRTDKHVFNFLPPRIFDQSFFKFGSVWSVWIDSLIALEYRHEEALRTFHDRKMELDMEEIHASLDTNNRLPQEILQGRYSGLTTESSSFRYDLFHFRAEKLITKLLNQLNVLDFLMGRRVKSENEKYSDMPQNYFRMIDYIRILKKTKISDVTVLPSDSELNECLTPRFMFREMVASTDFFPRLMKYVTRSYASIPTVSISEPFLQNLYFCFYMVESGKFSLKNVYTADHEKLKQFRFMYMLTMIARIVHSDRDRDIKNVPLLDLMPESRLKYMLELRKLKELQDSFVEKPQIAKDDLDEKETLDLIASLSGISISPESTAKILSESSPSSPLITSPSSSSGIHGLKTSSISPSVRSEAPPGRKGKRKRSTNSSGSSSSSSSSSSPMSRSGNKRKRARTSSDRDEDVGSSSSFEVISTSNDVIEGIDYVQEMMSNAEIDLETKLLTLRDALATEQIKLLTSHWTHYIPGQDVCELVGVEKTHLLEDHINNDTKVQGMLESWVLPYVYPLPDTASQARIAMSTAAMHAIHSMDTTRMQFYHANMILERQNNADYKPYTQKWNARKTITRSSVTIPQVAALLLEDPRVSNPPDIGTGFLSYSWSKMVLDFAHPFVTNMEFQTVLLRNPKIIEKLFRWFYQYSHKKRQLDKVAMYGHMGQISRELIKLLNDINGKMATFISDLPKNLAARYKFVKDELMNGIMDQTIVSESQISEKEAELQMEERFLLRVLKVIYDTYQTEVMSGNEIPDVVYRTLRDTPQQLDIASVSSLLKSTRLGVTKFAPVVPMDSREPLQHLQTVAAIHGKASLVATLMDKIIATYAAIDKNIKKAKWSRLALKHLKEHQTYFKKDIFGFFEPITEGGSIIVPDYQWMERTVDRLLTLFAFFLKIDIFYQVCNDNTLEEATAEAIYDSIKYITLITKSVLELLKRLYDASVDDKLVYIVSAHQGESIPEKKIYISLPQIVIQRLEGNDNLRPQLLQNMNKSRDLQFINIRTKARNCQLLDVCKDFLAKENATLYDLYKTCARLSMRWSRFLSNCVTVHLSNTIKNTTNPLELCSIIKHSVFLDVLCLRYRSNFMVHIEEDTFEIDKEAMEEDADDDDDGEPTTTRYKTKTKPWKQFINNVHAQKFVKFITVCNEAIIIQSGLEGLGSFRFDKALNSSNSLQKKEIYSTEAYLTLYKKNLVLWMKGMTDSFIMTVMDFDARNAEIKYQHDFTPYDSYSEHKVHVEMFNHFIIYPLTEISRQSKSQNFGSVFPAFMVDDPNDAKKPGPVNTKDNSFLLEQAQEWTIMIDWNRTLTATQWRKYKMVTASSLGQIDRKVEMLLEKFKEIETFSWFKTERDLFDYQYVHLKKPADVDFRGGPIEVFDESNHSWMINSYNTVRFFMRDLLLSHLVSRLRYNKDLAHASAEEKANVVEESDDVMDDNNEDNFSASSYVYGPDISRQFDIFDDLQLGSFYDGTVDNSVDVTEDNAGFGNEYRGEQSNYDYAGSYLGQRTMFTDTLNKSVYARAVEIYVGPGKFIMVYDDVWYYLNHLVYGISTKQMQDEYFVRAEDVTVQKAIFALLVLEEHTEVNHLRHNPATETDVKIVGRWNSLRSALRSLRSEVTNWKKTRIEIDQHKQARKSNIYLSEKSEREKAIHKLQGLASKIIIDDDDGN